MNTVLEKLAWLIRQLIDFFYPLFQRFMPIQTYRYLVSGSSNTLLGIVIYYLSYQFAFKGSVFHVGFYAFKAHSAALFASFAVTFPIGFFLSKFVVFSGSLLRSRVQLFRYFMVCLFNLFLNYLLLKILVEVMLMNVLVSQFLTVSGVVAFSYIAQRNFSFHSKP
jgi:putative flippase GtrA